MKVLEENCIDAQYLNMFGVFRITKYEEDYTSGLLRKDLDDFFSGSRGLSKCSLKKMLWIENSRKCRFPSLEDLSSKY